MKIKMNNIITKTLSLSAMAVFFLTTAQARMIDHQDSENELRFTPATLNAQFMQGVTRELTDHFFDFYKTGEKYFPILTSLKQKIDCKEWVQGYYRASLETNDIQTAFQMDRWHILTVLIKASVNNITTSQAYLSPKNSRSYKSISKFVVELQSVIQMIERKRGPDIPVHISPRLETH